MKPEIKNIIKSTIILAVVTFAASFVLSHVNRITYPNILKQEREKQERALSVVLPGYSNIEKKKTLIDNKVYIYWTGDKIEEGKTAKGFAFISGSSGYSGLVQSMVGIDENGIILGLSILQQTETPGLGARSVEVATSETFLGYIFGSEASTKDESIAPWFQEQFKGLNTTKTIDIVKRGDWSIEIRDELLNKNAISAITGATITTRAVRDSIASGIKDLQRVMLLETGSAGAEE